MGTHLTFIIQTRVLEPPFEGDETVGGLIVETLEERTRDIEAIGLSLARFLTDAAQGKAIVTSFAVMEGLDLTLNFEPTPEGEFRRTPTPPPFEQTRRLLDEEAGRTFVPSPHGPLPVPTNEELDLADRGQAPPPMT